MGRPKQLLPYNGKSLLEHAVDVANEAEANPVIVVSGSDAALIEKQIDEKKVHVVENKEWKEGMASSIRCGLNTLIHIAPSSDAVILMVCDQPYVTAALANDLIATQRKTGKLIVTSQYENAIGPPALFYKTIFPELLELKGEAGARKIVERHSDDVATVLFTQGNIDIDTVGEYEDLVNKLTS
jgi:molybdenum cofactor cytidylyltransferase